MPVVPLLAWRPSDDEQYRAQGRPLPEVFAEVLRCCYPRPGTRRSTVRVVAELAAALGDHPGPLAVAAWRDALLGRLAPSTVVLYVKALATVYEKAGDLGIARGNPAKLVELPRVRGTPHHIVNMRDLWPSILGVCQGARERLLLALQYMAALRVGEALAVRLEDVNTYADPWELEVVDERHRDSWDLRGHVKGYKGARCIAVPPDLRPFLEAVLPLGKSPVGVGLGGGEIRVVSYLCPFQRDDLDRLLRRLRRVAPDAFPTQKGKAWHSLRDTSAVETLRSGAPVGEVSELLGHASERVTREHYLGKHGRRVRSSITFRAAAYRGLSPPPELSARDGPGWRGGAPAVTAAGAPRVEPTSQPAREATCSTTRNKTQSVNRKPVQRALPSLAVSPVVQPPKRPRKEGPK